MHSDSWALSDRTVVHVRDQLDCQQPPCRPKLPGFGPLETLHATSATPTCHSCNGRNPTMHGTTPAPQRLRARIPCWPTWVPPDQGRRRRLYRRLPSRLAGLTHPTERRVTCRRRGQRQACRLTEERIDRSSHRTAETIRTTSRGDSQASSLARRGRRRSLTCIPRSSRTRPRSRRRTVRRECRRSQTDMGQSACTPGCTSRRSNRSAPMCSSRGYTALTCTRGSKRRARRWARA